MIFTRICEVQNHQLVIPMPKEYEHKKVRVIIEDAPKTKEEKIRLMMQAANDPLFQADVAEIMEDFKYVDREHLGEDEDQ